MSSPIVTPVSVVESSGYRYTISIGEMIAELLQLPASRLGVGGPGAHECGACVVLSATALLRTRQGLTGRARWASRFVIFDAPNDANLHVYLKEMQKHKVGHVVRVCDSTYETKVPYT